MKMAKTQNYIMAAIDKLSTKKDIGINNEIMIHTVFIDGKKTRILSISDIYFYIVRITSDPKEIDMKDNKLNTINLRWPITFVDKDRDIIEGAKRYIEKYCDKVATKRPGGTRIPPNINMIVVLPNPRDNEIAGIETFTLREIEELAGNNDYGSSRRYFYLYNSLDKNKKRYIRLYRDNEIENNTVNKE